MGLGAPKRRNKLAHDPNNTAWSRSTSNFGHRILSKQGWQPGQYLGAEHANHSDHYTAANASHIRILLREDNLGLGAELGGNKAETFGLSLFSGVLGRLNGKSDVQVQRQQDALRDAELRQYQVGKYGLMNFVSGGLLVGDKMEKRGEKGVAVGNRPRKTEAVEEGMERKRKAVKDDSGEDGTTQKKQKTRDAKEDEDSTAAGHLNFDEDVSTVKCHRTKGKKDKCATDKPECDETSEAIRLERKSKKRQKTAATEDPSTSKMSIDEKARMKQEKRARKEDRRKRKEAKRLKKEAKLASVPVAEVEREAKPVIQNAFNGGRHAVRQRYIQQKRMAGLDAQAMKEIFMIKPVAA